MKELSPITYVTSDAPPFLFLHGDQDDVVPPECALRLHDKLTAHNVSSEFYMLEGATHASAHFSQESIQNDAGIYELQVEYTMSCHFSRHREHKEVYSDYTSVN